MNRLKNYILLFLTLATILSLPAIANSQGKTQAIRQDAELVVHTAASGLGGLLKNVKDTQKQIEMIQSFINPIRFFPDKSGYFYVYTRGGICVAHATQPQLINKDLSGLTDAKGFKIIQALMRIAQEGGGFLEYTWNKPGADGQFPKLGYVEPIPGTEFFIGSGIYLPRPW